MRMHVKDLARAILTLLKDEGKCRDLGVKGRGYVRKLSWESVARKELEVFRKITKPMQGFSEDS